MHRKRAGLRPCGHRDKCLLCVGRNWCVTIDCHDRKTSWFDELGIRLSNAVNNGHVRYLVFQVEVGEESKRYHLQGYIELKTTQRMSYVKKMLDCNEAHLERRSGTRDEARAYCMKADTRAPGYEPIEIGIWVRDKQRTDVDTYVDAIKKGATKMYLIDNYPTQFCRFPRVYNDIKSAMLESQVTQTREVKVFYYYGVPGTGKSYHARLWAERHGLDYFHITKNMYPWYDGYNGEDVLIIDDLNDAWIPADSLLQILDKYKCTMQIKGNTVAGLWNYVFITSNYLPEEIGYLVNLSALKRRIYKMVKFTKVYEGVQSEPIMSNWEDMSDDEKENPDRVY